RSISSTGNTWEAFEYDPYFFGSVTRYHRPFQNSPSAPPSDLANDTAGEITSYTYVSDAFGAPTRPTSIVTRVDNTLTAKTTDAYTDTTIVNNMYLVQAIRDEQTDSGGGAVRSIVKYYREDTADPFFRSQIHSIQTPDGRKQSFAYQRGTW